MNHSKGFEMRKTNPGGKWTMAQRAEEGRTKSAVQRGAKTNGSAVKNENFRISNKKR
jgi:hypothetical protein